MFSRVFHSFRRISIHFDHLSGAAKLAVTRLAPEVLLLGGAAGAVPSH